MAWATGVGARFLLRFGKIFTRSDHYGTELLPDGAVISYTQGSSVPTGDLTVSCSPFNGSDAAVFHYGGKQIDGHLSGYNTSALPHGIRWGDFYHDIPGLSKPAYGHWIQVTPTAQKNVKQAFEMLSDSVAHGSITAAELDAIVAQIQKAASD